MVQGDNYASSAVVVEIARDFNLHISQAGLFVTAYLLPYGILALIFGPLADKYGKARVLNLGAFLVALFCTLGGFAAGLLSLSIIRAVNGIFAASIIPVTISLIGDRFSHDIKAMQNALGRALGMMFMGAAVAPVIAGGLTYLSSWRMVYFTYGFFIFITAFLLYKVLKKSHTPGNNSVDTLNRTLALKSLYGQAFANKRLMKYVGIEFFVGFSVLGSFMFSGDFVEQVTGYNIFWVGMALTFFGLGTVFGGRHAALVREKIVTSLFLYAGILGLFSWGVMGFLDSYYLMILSFLGFGFAFIFIHTFIVATSQELSPGNKGLVMSLISFNLFAGGGLGTLVNSYILNVRDFTLVFLLAGMFTFMAGFLVYKLSRS